MGILDSFFNPGKGYKKAGDTMEKYYQDAQGRLQPYAQGGTDQYNRLMEQANALNDPAALEAKWASGYEMSPYAQQAQKQAAAQGLDTASSMGLLGSSAALGNIQNSAGEIMQSDRTQYMNDLMNKYMQSIGIGQNMYNTGANAANAMSNNAMNQGQNMGQMAYGRQNAFGDWYGKMLGQGANMAMNYATGGTSGAANAMAKR